MQLFSMDLLPNVVFFVLRVVCQMLVHVFIVFVAVSIAAKTPITLFKGINL